MSRSTLRRVRRLKADHAHTIAEYERRKNERNKSLAVDHLLRIIAVFQYGDPRIDEPLALANRRALSKLGDLEAVALWRIRRIVEEEPPAGDIRSKISARVRQMPDLLLYLCAAFFSTSALGIEAPPRRKNASELELSQSDSKAWPFLPKGVLVPRGKRERSFLDEMSVEELLEYLDILQRPEEKITRRERRFLDDIYARGPGIGVFITRALESKQQQHATDNRDDRAGE